MLILYTKDNIDIGCEIKYRQCLLIGNLGSPTAVSFRFDNYFIKAIYKNRTIIQRSHRFN